MFSLGQMAAQCGNDQNLNLGLGIRSSLIALHLLEALYKRGSVLSPALEYSPLVTDNSKLSCIDFPSWRAQVLLARGLDKSQQTARGSEMGGNIFG